MNWTSGADYEDIKYELSGDGIAKITINRPEVRNAFRPETLIEVSDALEKAREDTTVGVIILTGAGDKAFCSGGDQRVRGDTGYVPGGQAVGRFHVTDLHVQIRRLPKPVDRHGRRARRSAAATSCTSCATSRSPPTTPASARPARRSAPSTAATARACCRRLVGPKKAKEFWMLCRQYDAQQALDMGLVNTVVPLDQLETETVQWCHEMLALSPFALRLVKASFHAEEDGLGGIQQLAHDANLLFYASDEAKEGREAYKAKRTPDFAQFPKRP